MIRFDKNLIYYKLPPVLYALLIIFVSTIPTAKPPMLNVPNIDKFYHGLEYCLLAVLIFRAFPGVHRSGRRKLLYILIFCFGLAYGALDETVQYFVPNRDSSFGDWLADAIGYFVGGSSYILYRVKASKNRPASEQE